MVRGHFIDTCHTINYAIVSLISLKFSLEERENVKVS